MHFNNIYINNIKTKLKYQTSQYMLAYKSAVIKREA